MLCEMYVVTNKHMADSRFFIVCDGYVWASSIQTENSLCGNK